MDGEKEFRFVSYNVPTLNFNEYEFAFDRLHPYSLPDEFELRDVFETISQMGGKVVRMYTLPVKFAFEPDDAPVYITGPGQFSEEAFKTMDMALALANEYRVPILWKLDTSGKYQYLKIKFEAETQLSRMELYYK
jgi:hypothetical protein